jgi:hypothetical protein
MEEAKRKALAARPQETLVWGYFQKDTTIENAGYYPPTQKNGEGIFRMKATKKKEAGGGTRRH